MKFVIVGPTHPFRGGIAQYTTYLHRYLLDRYPSFLVSLSRQYPSLFFPGRSQLDPSKSPLSSRPDYRMDSLNPLSWMRAARRIRSFHPDVVLFQWWHPFLSPAYTSILRHLKQQPETCAVFICHNVMPHEPIGLPGGQWLVRQLTKMAFRRADGFVTHAQALGPQIRHFNQVASIGQAFHPSYNFDSQSRSGAEERSTRHHPHCLLFFGNIRKYKGLETLLRALPLVAEKIPIRLLVAGEFYVDPQPFRRLARELDVQDLIVWSERYIPNEEVADLFGQADLVVLPYLAATQSGVVPLAYSFGVPVLTTDVGGLSQVVVNEKTGYLVPPGDPELIAQRIVSYFEDGRQEQFQANVREFRERLSWQQLIDTILALPGVKGALKPSA